MSEANFTIRYKRSAIHNANDNYSESEYSNYISYLTNPTKHGIWFLDCEWLFSQGITVDIKSMIDSSDNEDLFEKKTSDSLVEKTEKITFIFELFKRLLEKKQENDEFIEDIYEENDYKLIFTLLNISELRIKYQDALNYFERHIIYKDFNTNVGKELFKLNSGLMLIRIGPADIIKERNNSKIYSTTKIHPTYIKNNVIQFQFFEYNTLSHIKIFLEMIGKLKKTDEYAVYSPDNEVLSLYIPLAKKMIPWVVESESIRRLFDKCISDFESNNYTGTISTSGLIGEECLTQIYETLYRSVLPAHITLGELKEKIGERIKSLVSPSSSKHIYSREEIAKQIRELIKSGDKNNFKIHKLLMDYIDSQYDKTELKIKSLEGKETNFSLFPKLIKNNVEDLIRLRNTVSHKSSDPVGSTEAIKCVYYSLSLYIWWTTERKKIDWNKNENEVIMQFINKAKNSL